MGTEPLAKYKGVQRTPFQKLGGASRDRTDDLLHAMQALSQLSYSPKPKERHFPCQRRPCQGNIPVLPVTYAPKCAKNRLLADFQSSLGYWITTSKLMVKEGVPAPSLPFMAPVRVILKLVMAGSVQGRVQLGR
jgi:hypothetical protein